MAATAREIAASAREEVISRSRYEPPVDDISRTRTAVTSVDQLNDAGGSKEAKRSEFEQSFGFLDLAVLEPKSISLQRMFPLHDHRPAS